MLIPYIDVARLIAYRSASVAAGFVDGRVRLVCTLPRRHECAACVPSLRGRRCVAAAVVLQCRQCRRCRNPTPALGGCPLSLPGAQRSARARSCVLSSCSSSSCWATLRLAAQYSRSTFFSSAASLLLSSSTCAARGAEWSRLPGSAGSSGLVAASHLAPPGLDLALQLLDELVLRRDLPGLGLPDGGLARLNSARAGGCGTRAPRRRPFSARDRSRVLLALAFVSVSDRMSALSCAATARMWTLQLARV